MQMRWTSGFPEWRLAGSVLLGCAALGMLGWILSRGFDRNLLLAAAGLQAMSTILAFLAWLRGSGSDIEDVVTARVAARFEIAYGENYEAVEADSGDPTTEP